MYKLLLLVTLVIPLVLCGCSSDQRREAHLSLDLNSNGSNSIIAITNDQQPINALAKLQDATVRIFSADQEISIGKNSVVLSNLKASQLAGYDLNLYLNGFDLKPSYAMYRLGPFKSDAQPSNLDINFKGSKGQTPTLNYAIYNPIESVWKWYSTKTSKVHPIYYGYEWLYNYRDNVNKKSNKYLYVLFAVGKAEADAVTINSLDLTAITHTPPKKANWNVLFYLAGDNNLSEFAIDNINQIEQVGSTDNVNFLAQYDINNLTVLNADKVYRLKITKDFNPKAINTDYASGNPILKNGFDSSSPKNLYDFLIWAKTNYPAEKTCLVLWDHGGGWLPGHTEGRVTSSILSDDIDGPDKGELADNTTIAEAITKSGLDIDVLYFDACNMGQLESLYDFKDISHYIVGSQLLVPGPGGNYVDWLSFLVKQPTIDAVTLSKSAVNAYNNLYSANTDFSCSLAVYDTTSIESLTDSIKSLGESLISNKEAEQKLFHSAINDSFFDDEESSSGSRDLVEFLDYMNNTNNTKIKAQLSEVKNNCLKTVLYQKHPNLTRTNGVTLFLPNQFSYSAFDLSYKDIAFNKATNWLDTLQTLGVPSDTNSFEFSEEVYDNWKVRVYWNETVDLNLLCHEPSLNWNSPKTSSETEYCKYSIDATGVSLKEEWVLIKPSKGTNNFYIAVEYSPTQPASTNSQFWAQIIDNEGNVIKTFGPRSIKKGETYNLLELLKN